MSATPMLQGFSEPVFQSQASFRKIASALATPGRIVTVPDDIGVLNPLNVAAMATILTLADFETSVWISPALLDVAPVAEHIRFHTSAMLVADPAAASFAIVDLVSHDRLSLGLFAQGTSDYPDKSTTVIAIVPDLRNGPARRFVGPGIRDVAELLIEGLPDDFDDQWCANRTKFPLGVDMILTAGNELVGLPRSSRLAPEAC